MFGTTKEHVSERILDFAFYSLLVVALLFGVSHVGLVDLPEIFFRLVLFVWFMSFMLTSLVIRFLIVQYNFRESGSINHVGDVITTFRQFRRSYQARLLSFLLMITLTLAVVYYFTHNVPIPEWLGVLFTIVSAFYLGITIEGFGVRFK